MRFRNHLIFWLAYVLFKTYLNIGLDEVPDWNNTVTLLLAQCVYLLTKIPLVYISFFCIDKFMDRQWAFSTTGLIMIILFACAAISMSALNHIVILPYILHVTTSYSIFNPGSLTYHLFTLLFVTGIAVSIKLFRKQYRAHIREAELQKEKTETELKFLKSQLNPHFLFNTLNNIYSLARKNSTSTAEAVLKLSSLMRFMLYEAGHKNILLTDELKLIKDYIALEKLRYTDRLTIQYHEELDDTGQLITPLLLIHFVENAFKHGVSETRSESYVTITVKLNSGTLNVIIENSKAQVPPDTDVHIGLNNVKRQLELLYPVHDLSITDNPNTFTVQLSIRFRQT